MKACTDILVHAKLVIVNIYLSMSDQMLEGYDRIYVFPRKGKKTIQSLSKPLHRLTSLTHNPSGSLKFTAILAVESCTNLKISTRIAA
jgi:hypothetical protein